jgi:hypothetical protein
MAPCRLLEPYFYQDMFVSLCLPLPEGKTATKIPYGVFPDPAVYRLKIQPGRRMALWTASLPQEISLEGLMCAVLKFVPGDCMCTRDFRAQYQNLKKKSTTL